MESTQKYLKIALYFGVYTLISSLQEETDRADWVEQDHEDVGIIEYFEDRQGRFLGYNNPIASGARTIKKDLQWLIDEKILKVPEVYRKVTVYEEFDIKDRVEGKNLNLYQAMELAIAHLEARYARNKK